MLNPMNSKRNPINPTLNPIGWSQFAQPWHFLAGVWAEAWGEARVAMAESQGLLRFQETGAIAIEC